MVVVAVVACAAGGLESLAEGLVRPLLDLGHEVTITATPIAHRWLLDSEDDEKIRSLTGYEVRSDPRLPTERSPHPAPDVIVCAPATANTVAKLALGIADNQALTLLCENVATKPLVVFPRINAGHARHPAWAGHLAALRSAGVSLVYGPDVWPLFEPREAPPDRAVPWGEILRRVSEAIAA
jgi:hypothetical protein